MVKPIMGIAIRMMIAMISVSGGVGVWGFWFDCICSARARIVDLINLLIKAREAEIYKEKEKIVETLSKII
jgi:hypothetical protein